MTIKQFIWGRPLILFFLARFRAMWLMDTRSFTFMSGAMVLAWSLGLLFDPRRQPGGIAAKAQVYFDGDTLLLISLPLAVLLMFSSVNHQHHFRKTMNLFSLLWWTFFAVLAFTPPVQLTPAFYFAVLSLGSIWSVLTYTDD